MDDKGKEIVEEQEEDSDEHYDDEELSIPDEGPRLSYLVHRSYYITHTENVSQITNLFRTRLPLIKRCVTLSLIMRAHTI